MPIHNINIQAQSDCQELIARIRGTLSEVNPNVLGHIRDYPQPFIQSDTHIFEWLTPAVLSSGTRYYLLRPHLVTIKRILFNYDIVRIASLSDSDVMRLYVNYIKPLGIPSRQKFETRLLWMRDNAKLFMRIQREHGSVWHFIETNLGGSLFDHTHGCYIHPNDGYLIRYFGKLESKLKGVGLAICCEFFKNIGIDEFKPDVHTISFLNRVNLNKNNFRVSRRPDDVRKMGITIAQTLVKTRACIDSHIWVFCA